MNKVDIPFYIFLLLLHPIKTFNNLLKFLKDKSHQKGEEMVVIGNGVCICVEGYAYIKEGQVINFTKKSYISGSIWVVMNNGMTMREFAFNDHFIDISNKDFNTEL